MIRVIYLSLFLGVLEISGLKAKTFELDSSHTTIGFQVKHLVISTVYGRFDQFKGSFEVDDKTGALTAIHATVDAKSINTNEPDRDKHLRSADFFDVSTKGHETLEFSSNPFRIEKGKSGIVGGNLTIRGITHPVDWEIDYGGTIKDPYGNEKAAFEGKLKVNRKDYDLKWNKLIETGGVAVGDEVRIQVAAEGNVKEDEAAEASATPAKKPAKAKK